MSCSPVGSCFPTEVAGACLPTEAEPSKPDHPWWEALLSALSPPSQSLEDEHPDVHSPPMPPRSSPQGKRSSSSANSDKRSPSKARVDDDDDLPGASPVPPPRTRPQRLAVQNEAASVIQSHCRRLVVRNTMSAARSRYAAILMQCAVRGMLARRARAAAHDLRDRRRRLARMLVAVEDAKAARIQSAWRQRRTRRLAAVAEHELRRAHAASRLAAVARGRSQREQETRLALATVVVAAMRVQRWARRRIERAALQEGCRAVLLKQVTRRVPLPLGLEARLWRKRYVCLSSGALCYQKLQSSGSRTGGVTVDVDSTRVLRYADIERVSGQLSTRLLLVQQRRRAGFVQYSAYRERFGDEGDDNGGGPDEIIVDDEYDTLVHLFQLPSAEATELWTTSLVRLIALAGYTCDGSLEVGAEQFDGVVSSIGDEREQQQQQEATCASALWHETRRRSLEEASQPPARLHQGVAVQRKHTLSPSAPEPSVQNRVKRAQGLAV